MTLLQIIAFAIMLPIMVLAELVKKLPRGRRRRRFK